MNDLVLIVDLFLADHEKTSRALGLKRPQNAVATADRGCAA